jgi:hypothetical protein
MSVKHVEAFGDSLLVVQQIAGTFQCLDESLNAYLDKYLKIIIFSMILLYSIFPEMKIQWQMIWHNKHQVFNRIEKNSVFYKKPNVLFCQIRQSGFQPMCSAIVCSVGPSPTKLDSRVSETRWSRISRTSNKSSKTTMVDPDD